MLITELKEVMLLMPPLTSQQNQSRMNTDTLLFNSDPLLLFLEYAVKNTI
jgi:hypothetical protein